MNKILCIYHDGFHAEILGNYINREMSSIQYYNLDKRQPKSIDEIFDKIKYDLILVNPFQYDDSFSINPFAYKIECEMPSYSPFSLAAEFFKEKDKVEEELIKIIKFNNQNTPVVVITTGSDESRAEVLGSLCDGSILLPLNRNKVLPEIIRNFGITTKPYSSNRKRVFISYAREDLKIVELICEELETNGYCVWLDQKCLLPGHNWEFEIEKAIKNSDVFIACLSSNSVNKKGYVQAELKRGIKLMDNFPEDSIFLIPLLLDNCLVPHRLKDIHCFKYSQEESLQRVFSAIEKNT